MNICRGSWRSIPELDQRLLGWFELSRALPLGLAAVLMVSAEWNLSTLGTSSPVNHSYSRVLALGSLRWHWGP